MPAKCRICGKESAALSHDAQDRIVQGICEACSCRPHSAMPDSRWLEAIRAPVLLMQANPRQVVTANRHALALFEKGPGSVEGRRGGEIFDCVHSFSEAGCGKDANCEHCTIKHAIVDTFTMAGPQKAVSAQLSVRKSGGTQTYVLQISTERLGDLALVRIDRYAPDTEP